VDPGRLSVMALRRPQILLKSVDLPTLGRPTSATFGTLISLTPFSA
jgi:hypothetical protein